MSVTFRIDSPHSAHPTLVSHLDLLSSHPNCSLAFLHILPADLIVDRFQLRDLYVEGRVVSSNERLPLPSTSSLRIDADRDLEAPVYNLDQRETYLVIDLPEATSAHVSLPVHIRYQAPRAAPSPPGHRRVSVASGHIVATCPRGRDEEDDACFTSLVPPRGRALLPPGHHTLPRSSLSCAPPLTTQLLIPAAAQRDLAWVEPVNIVVVWTSFIFLLSMAWRKRPTGRKEV